MARKRRYGQAFKLAAVTRMSATEDVAGLAAELGVDRGLLYKWNRAFQLGGGDALLFPWERSWKRTRASRSQALDGEAGLPVPERPPIEASTAELERKVAQQALELDFFRAALRHVAGGRRESGEPGETGSTP